jgi:hypothetical protein
MPSLYIFTEVTGDTEVLAYNVYLTNLSCKASFIESFVIVHKVNAVDLRLFSRCLPKTNLQDADSFDKLRTSNTDEPATQMAGKPSKKSGG